MRKNFRQYPLAIQVFLHLLFAVALRSCFPSYSFVTGFSCSSRKEGLRSLNRLCNTGGTGSSSASSSADYDLPNEDVSSNHDNNNDDNLESSSLPYPEEERISSSFSECNEEKRSERIQKEKQSKSRFANGDDLFALRKKVELYRQRLEESRVKAPHDRSFKEEWELEKAIGKLQSSDAEHVYRVSLERLEEAKKASSRWSGSYSVEDAKKYERDASAARSTLLQFNLEGLWVGRYGSHGYEMINVTYVEGGDMLVAHKVGRSSAGGRVKTVPKGEVSFTVDLSPLSRTEDEEFEKLEPFELVDAAAKTEWGTRYLPRFPGHGRVSSENIDDSRWMDGQLILVGDDYFSFAWLPIATQVFFGRPSAEVALQLLQSASPVTEIKGENNENIVDQAVQDRDFLERCGDKTEFLLFEYDDEEADFFDGDQQDYYHREGSFE